MTKGTDTQDCEKFLRACPVHEHMDGRLHREGLRKFVQMYQIFGHITRSLTRLVFITPLSIVVHSTIDLWSETCFRQSLRQVDSRGCENWCKCITFLDTSQEV